jgi:hypothetical protein
MDAMKSIPTEISETDKKNAFVSLMSRDRPSLRHGNLMNESGMSSLQQQSQSFDQSVEDKLSQAQYQRFKQEEKVIRLKKRLDQLDGPKHKIRTKAGNLGLKNLANLDI